MIDRKSIKDRQKSKVYRWENKYIASMDYEHFDLSKSQSLVDDIFNGYHIKKKLKVVNSQTQRRCVYIGSKFEIRLAEWGKCRPTILHEISHTLTRYYYGYTVPSHGKEFVGFLMYLLNIYSRIPVKEMVTTAESMGVEFVHPSEIDRMSKKFKPDNKLRSNYTIINLPRVPENAYVVMEKAKYGGFLPVYYYD